MLMLADVVQFGGIAKAGDVLIALWIPAFAGMTVGVLPGMEGVGDFLDVVRREVAQYAVFHVAHLAGVDEQEFAAPVALLLVQCETVLLVAGQEPDAGGNLGVGEQLAGQRHHAFHIVVLDQPLADFAFVVGVGAHGAVGQQQRHAAGGREVPEHVLQPGEVGVALRRRAGNPARVVGQLFVPPFLHVEGWVGHDEIGAQVWVQIVEQGVGRAAAEVEVDTADGHVHGGQPPGGGVAFLPVDADVALAVGGFAAVLFDELLALHEEAAGAHGRIVHTAFERLEHFHDQSDDALGRVVLAALFAFGQGELAEEVFVDVAKDVLGFQVQRLALVLLGAEVGIREVADQPGQLAGVELHAGEVLVEHVLQASVLALDGFHGVVDQPADRAHVLRLVLAGLVPRQRRLGRQLRAVAQGLPAGFHRHPEHVFLGVVVAHFELGGDVVFVRLRGRSRVKKAAVFVRVHVVVMIRVGELFTQFALPFFEGIGDVLEEDQTEHDVLVHGGIEVGAQLVGSGPELLFQVVEELLFDGFHTRRITN